MGKRPVGIIVGVTLTALLACSSNSGGDKPKAPRDAGAMLEADGPVDATKPIDVLMPMDAPPESSRRDVWAAAATDVHTDVNESECNYEREPSEGKIANDLRDALRAEPRKRAVFVTLVDSKGPDAEKTQACLIARIRAIGGEVRELFRLHITGADLDADQAEDIAALKIVNLVEDAERIGPI